MIYKSYSKYGKLLYFVRKNIAVEIKFLERKFRIFK